MREESVSAQLIPSIVFYMLGYALLSACVLCILWCFWMLWRDHIRDHVRAYLARPLWKDVRGFEARYAGKHGFVAVDYGSEISTAVFGHTDRAGHIVFEETMTVTHSPDGVGTALDSAEAGEYVSVGLGRDFWSDYVKKDPISQDEIDGAIFHWNTHDPFGPIAFGRSWDESFGRVFRGPKPTLYDWQQKPEWDLV